MTLVIYDVADDQKLCYPKNYKILYKGG
jgi:hypothetical protein